MQETRTRRVTAPFAPASLRQEKGIHGHHSGLIPRPAIRQTELLSGSMV